MLSERSRLSLTALSRLKKIPDSLPFCLLPSEGFELIDRNTDDGAYKFTLHEARQEGEIPSGWLAEVGSGRILRGAGLGS